MVCTQLLFAEHARSPFPDPGNQCLWAFAGDLRRISIDRAGENRPFFAVDRDGWFDAAVFAAGRLEKALQQAVEKAATVRRKGARL